MNLPESVPEQWVMVSEAAKQLGISERAIFAKLKAGTLTRRKINGRVHVNVPLPEAVHEGTESDSASVHEENEAPTESEVMFLRRMVENHQREIERRDQAEAEMRRLLLADREEIRRLRQQLAIPAAPSEALVTDAPVEAPQSAQEARTEEKAPETVQRARHWWEFWKK